MKVAAQLREPGDLINRQMCLDFPSATLEKQIWCSNFQSTKQNCPEQVKRWLKENIQKRFEN